MKTIKYFTDNSLWPKEHLIRYTNELEEKGWSILSVKQVSREWLMFGDNTWEIKVSKSTKNRKE